MTAQQDYGICICGLNGTGKTTLAQALAKALQFYHMDIESYWFPASDLSYSSPRTREEVHDLLLADVRSHPRFVFSAVNGDMGEEINARYRLVVCLSAPADIRMERIRQRSYDRFGARMLIGGDLYEQEQAFFRAAAQKSPARIEAWLRTLACPVLRLDATAAPKDILRQILSALPR